ncbi:mucin-6-like [Canis lupus dingo]|uniref:mucin-6-like n=1 Tax=Canis lupus dingo TaxID=286419 RepID=UPI0020C4FF4C|nr:mucin-6-like [Canis lupus dingo]
MILMGFENIYAHSDFSALPPLPCNVSFLNDRTKTSRYVTTVVAAAADTSRDLPVPGPFTYSFSQQPRTSGLGSSSPLWPLYASLGLGPRPCLLLAASLLSVLLLGRRRSAGRLPRVPGPEHADLPQLCPPRPAPPPLRRPPPPGRRRPLSTQGPPEAGSASPLRALPAARPQDAGPWSPAFGVQSPSGAALGRGLFAPVTPPPQGRLPCGTRRPPRGRTLPPNPGRPCVRCWRPAPAAPGPPQPLTVPQRLRPPRRFSPEGPGARGRASRRAPRPRGAFTRACAPHRARRTRTTHAHHAHTVYAHRTHSAHARTTRTHHAHTPRTHHARTPRTLHARTTHTARTPYSRRTDFAHAHTTHTSRTPYAHCAHTTHTQCTHTARTPRTHARTTHAHRAHTTHSARTPCTQHARRTHAAQTPRTRTPRTPHAHLTHTARTPRTLRAHTARTHCARTHPRTHTAHTHTVHYSATMKVQANRCGAPQQPEPSP